MRGMEVGVGPAEAPVVEVLHQLDLRRAGRRLRGIVLAPAGGQREDRDEREQGDAPHDSESFRIPRNTPLI